MKITYLHQYYNNTTMNGGTRSYEFAKRLVQRGHEVHMITSWRDGGKGDDWFETIDDGIYIHWLPVEYSNHMSFTLRLKAFFKFAFKSARKAVQIRSDVIFATSTPLTIILPAVWAKFKLGVPIVFEVRDLWPELPIAMGALRSPISKISAKILERFAYFNSEIIVALSPGMKNGIIRSGFPKDRIAVIPNCADIELFDVARNLGDKFREERPWLGDSPLILYAGTFGAINGVSYLVDLAVEFKKINSTVKILVIGDGAEYNLVIDHARRSNVLDINFFVEKGMPKAGIIAALSAATFASAVFIDKPEMRANSANKFFDALAAGKPLIINFGGWMHDLVLRNDCGIAAWRMDLNQLACEINEKSNNFEWLSSASESSRKLASKEFDRDRLSNKLAIILEQTANKNNFSAEQVAPDEF